MDTAIYILAPDISIYISSVTYAIQLFFCISHFT